MAKEGKKKGKKKAKSDQPKAIEERTAPPALTPRAYGRLQSKFMAQWADLMVGWGYPKAMGLVHGWLLTKSTSSTMTDVIARASVSQGTAHSMLKKLVQLGLVIEEREEGVRTIRYKAERDARKIATGVMADRRRRELDPILLMRKTLAQLPEPVALEDSSASVNALDDATAFSSTLDPIVSWAEQVDAMLTTFQNQDEKWWKRVVKKWIVRI
jgi:DNA-binding transcriptional regulator GbsR (MarR family)